MVYRHFGFGIIAIAVVLFVMNPDADWPWPAVITHSPHWHGTNHAVRSREYHYIHYQDGGEELYDVAADPYQWKNLADDPQYADAKKTLKSHLPKTNAPHFRPSIRE
ncbi:MAG: sulfatase/phosphatase domain-containing protein [Fuerstiella sp.]|mgnify:CR=1 FL=1